LSSIKKRAALNNSYRCFKIHEKKERFLLKKLLSENPEIIMLKMEAEVLFSPASSRVASMERANELMSRVHETRIPKMSLVLDLDETLVFSSFAEPEHYDFVVEVMQGTTATKVYIRKRPGVDEFITAAAWEFDLFIFTASLANYAVPVIQGILPCFPAERVLSRAHCRLVNGLIVKDLSIFGRDLARMILVDNSPQSFIAQPENGIVISTWQGDLTDGVLLNELLPFLRICAGARDVREVLNPADS
jgi:Dullard-like phosphatase family protein